MNLAVDQPILNTPFEEPTRYWLYERGQPVVMNGRRPAGYYFKVRRRDDEPQLTLFTDEQFVELEIVNIIRQRVKDWRGARYPGVTPITRQLLSHWNNPVRERRLFFCQREAAETIIWLTEVQTRQPRGLRIPTDESLDEASRLKGYRPLRRYGCKMATGSGKTVVMAMVAAWSVLNKAYYPQDRRFSDAVLVVCPNLTVKERLQVLYPSDPMSYYQAFDLVPRSLLDALGQGKFLVTNWHAFAPEDDSRNRSVVQRGPESDPAFANRVLKGLGSKKNLLVLNDEAHHAYRPAPYEVDDEEAGLIAEERRRLKQEKEKATVWISGLDRVHAARTINFCMDLSGWFKIMVTFLIFGAGKSPLTPLYKGGNQHSPFIKGGWGDFFMLLQKCYLSSFEK